jgi:ATP-dependent DNA helicase RecG
VLLYRPPLSDQARSRLGVLRDSHDGFAIARRDMELRGPGEVLGTRQTGSLGMRIADLLRDEDLLPVVQTEAETLLREHPGAVGGLIERWIGDGGRYGEV